jgi:hypothetical protein
VNVGTSSSRIPLRRFPKVLSCGNPNYSLEEMSVYYSVDLQRVQHSTPPRVKIGPVKTTVDQCCSDASGSNENRVCRGVGDSRVQIEDVEVSRGQELSILS